MWFNLLFKNFICVYMCFGPSYLHFLFQHFPDLFHQLCPSPNFLFSYIFPNTTVSNYTCLYAHVYTPIHRNTDKKYILPNENLGEYLNSSI